MTKDAALAQHADFLRSRQNLIPAIIRRWRFAMYQHHHNGSGSFAPATTSHEKWVDCLIQAESVYQQQIDLIIIKIIIGIYAKWHASIAPRMEINVADIALKYIMSFKFKRSDESKDHAERWMAAVAGNLKHRRTGQKHPKYCFGIC